MVRMSGRIDPAGRAAALRNLAVLEEAYGQVPELERQRVDLETWHNPEETGHDGTAKG